MTMIEDAMDKTTPCLVKDARQHLVRGDLLLKAHQSPLGAENLLDEALNAYAQAMEEMPDSPLLASRTSKVFFLKGEYERATLTARKALSLIKDTIKAHGNSRRDDRPAERDAYYVLGLIQMRNSQHTAAEQNFVSAWRAGGQFSARLWFAMFQNFRDQALSQPWNPNSLTAGLKAIVCLLASAPLFPLERERPPFSVLLLLLPRLLMAWLMEETRWKESATAHYQDIARDYPGLAGVALVLGDMQRSRGELGQARYWFEAVIRRHPANLDAHYHLAQLLEQEEAYPEMAEVYQRLNALRPNDPHIHCNLANACYYLQDYQQAMAYYETALQLGKDPEWKAMVAQSIGNILLDYSQNPQAASAYYQLARMLDPGNVENYIQLGMIYFQHEDYVNAELVYRKAVAIAPKNPRLYSNLGYLRWLEGDANGAIQLYQQAIKLDSGYEIPINNLGVIYLDMLGDVNHAVALFKQAIELDENYSLAYYNLGRAYSFLDNRLEAAHCFQMAQELNQFSRDLDNDELVARIQHLFETCELELLD